MDSKIGLLIQLAGVALITLLTLFLRRSINVVALKHWTNAWLFLAFALFCLRLAFSYDEYSLQLFSIYFLTEYLFGFLLVAGCASLSDNAEMRVRHELFILPFIVVAFGMPFLGDDFNLIFNIHSVILAGFFGYAFVTLARTRLGSFGWKVMLVALGLLTVDFFQYFLVFTARTYIVFDTSFLAYNPIIDLVLQILLGFGMVIILLEKVMDDVKVANEKLKAAHQKLEVLAHVDPLTTALNRHAFHGYLKRRGDQSQPVSGCVGFFDIDDLKTINDVHGHAAGDMIIRAVVRGIREVIRAEDLIFRWGGDEFFVLMVGFTGEEASERFVRLDTILAHVQIDGVKEPLTIGVSHAFADFADLGDLESTIERADAGMYLRKQERKAQLSREELVDAPATEEVLVEA